MTESIGSGETRSPRIIKMFQIALPANPDDGLRWDYLDDTGITEPLCDEDIEWLGRIGLTSKDEHTRELSATLFALGYVQLSEETTATLERMALHETEFDKFPPARFRAAAALWEKGDHRPELKRILEEVSRHEWNDVERHTADRMAVAADTYLQDIPRRRG